MDATPVWRSTGPDVFANIDGLGTPKDVVSRWRVAWEERVKLRLVQLGQNVWDTIVEPGLIRSPVVLSWGPRRGVRYQSRPYAHETGKGGIIVWVTSVTARRFRGAKVVT